MKTVTLVIGTWHPKLKFVKNAYKLIYAHNLNHLLMIKCNNLFFFKNADQDVLKVVSVFRDRGLAHSVTPTSDMGHVFLKECNGF